jgi:hypothetical protein
VDENNPYTAMQVYHNVYEKYQHEDVEVIIIPDIESVNYGRGVGYEINEHIPPPDIHEISATKIREGWDGSGWFTSNDPLGERTEGEK